MTILNQKISKDDLQHIEPITYFEDMIKCVVDIDKELIAVNAELHADLEQLLLDDGSKQSSLYGINIIYDLWEIEYDSLINPPRNRDAGFLRAGREVADPVAREKIEKVVKKWIQM